MAIAQDVRTYLLTKSAVTTLVGTRIFPSFIPQSNTTYPCIVYNLINQLPAHMLSGGAGYAETRVQLDVYATTLLVAESLAEVLRDELQGYKGTMGSSTVSSVVYKNMVGFYEPPQDQSDTGLFRYACDYWIRHNQAVPTFA